MRADPPGFFGCVAVVGACGTTSLEERQRGYGGRLPVDRDGGLRNFSANLLA
ncbi:MAG: hypothetical protein ABSH09_34250 [Bryobacteraceae bacterium]